MFFTRGYQRGSIRTVQHNRRRGRFLMTRASRGQLEDRLGYRQQQKVGMVEIFVTLRLPINVYETAAGLYTIRNFRSFDDYVSNCVMDDLGTLAQGGIGDDILRSKLTGMDSQYMQSIKEGFGPIVKRMEEQARIERKARKREARK